MSIETLRNEMTVRPELKKYKIIALHVIEGIKITFGTFI